MLLLYRMDVDLRHTWQTVITYTERSNWLAVHAEGKFIYEMRNMLECGNLLRWLGCSGSGKEPGGDEADKHR